MHPYPKYTKQNQSQFTHNTQFTHKHQTLDHYNDSYYASYMNYHDTNPKGNTNKRGYKYESKHNDNEYEEDVDEGNDTTITNENQMQALSQVVKNLVIKNKLNSKNAFDVPIIDVTCLKAIQKNDDSSWSKISNALENSFKVYGYRVDFMADSINKITSNIARSQQTNELNFTQLNKLKKQATDRQQSQDAAYDEVSNQIEDDWLEEICNKQLDRDKNNKEEDQQFQPNNHSVQNIRRMFDQNGIAGLLLARLPISQKLNIIIDENIQFLSQHPTQSPYINLPDQNFYNKDLRIIEQICHFRTFCQSHNQHIQPKQQCLFDCYNVSFDQFPQIFLNDNRDDQCDNAQMFFQTIPCEDYFGQNMYSQKEQFEKNELNDSHNSSLLRFDSNPNEISHYRNIIQAIGGNKSQIQKNNQIKGKKSRNKQKKTKRAKGQKKQDSQIDFTYNGTEMKRSLILSSNSSRLLKNQRPRKLKDKHIQTVMLPKFEISKQTNYLPITLQQANDISDIVCNPENQVSKANMEDHKFTAPYSFIPFEQFLTSQPNSEGLLFRAPNIKNTKLKLWEIVCDKPSIQFKKLYEIYEKQRGSASEAIIFLSLLHLCNEKGLEIKESENGLEVINANCLYS